MIEKQFLMLPPPGILTPERALEWLEWDGPALVSLLSDAQLVPSLELEARCAFGFLCHEVERSLSACARSVRTQETVEVGPAAQTLDGDWLHHTAALGHALAAYHAPGSRPHFEAFDRGAAILMSELCRRLAWLNERASRLGGVQ